MLHYRELFNNFTWIKKYHKTLMLHDRESFNLLFMDQETSLNFDVTLHYRVLFNHLSMDQEVYISLNLNVTLQGFIQSSIHGSRGIIELECYITGFYSIIYPWINSIIKHFDVTLQGFIQSSIHGSTLSSNILILHYRDLFNRLSMDQLYHQTF